MMRCTHEVLCPNVLKCQKEKGKKTAPAPLERMKTNKTIRGSGSCFPGVVEIVDEGAFFSRAQVSVSVDEGKKVRGARFSSPTF